MEPLFNPVTVEEMPEFVFINQVKSLQMLSKLSSVNPKTTFYMPVVFLYFYRQLMKKCFTRGINLVEIEDNEEVHGVRAVKLQFHYRDTVIDDSSDLEFPPLSQRRLTLNFRRVQDISKLLSHYKNRALLFNYEARDIVMDVSQVFSDHLLTTDKAKFLQEEQALQQEQYLDHYIILNFQAPIMIICEQKVELTESQIKLIKEKVSRRDHYYKALFDQYPRRPDWMRDIPWENGTYVVGPVE